MNWRRALGSLFTVLILPILVGAVGSKLGGLPWEGLWPFLKHLPGTIRIALTWPIPTPAWVAVLVVLGLIWLSARVLRLWFKEQETKRRENESVDLFVDNPPAKIRWRFVATRGNPLPTLSHQRRHCLECDAPLVVLDGPYTSTSWMAGGTERTLQCPMGHVSTPSTYQKLEQDREIAMAAALHLATDFFNDQIKR